MKTPNTKLHQSLFRQESGDQSIRIIKAAQASKLLGGATGGHTHGANDVHKKPEIRMIHAGADYCDLEVVCGCGESTQVRCWNNPVEEQRVAA